MSLVLPTQKAEFEITPSGAHIARCYRIVDLGTQLVEFQGESKKQHKIMISWELPAELMKDGRPFSIHKKFTLSSHKKATLRKDLESWRGVPFSDEDFGKFDLGVLLTKPCMIGIVHSVVGENTYANISSIMNMPKGQTAPSLVNECVYFSLSDFKQDLYDKLSENLRATIAKSPEYQAIKGTHLPDPNVHDEMENFAPAEIPSEEIPF
jgi:hypothetical protein